MLFYDLLYVYDLLNSCTILFFYLKIILHLFIIFIMNMIFNLFSFAFTFFQFIRLIITAFYLVFLHFVKLVRDWLPLVSTFFILMKSNYFFVENNSHFINGTPVFTLISFLYVYFVQIFQVITLAQSLLIIKRLHLIKFMFNF